MESHRSNDSTHAAKRLTTSTSDQSRGSTRVYSAIPRLWWCESICCVLAVGGLLAVVITLRVYEDQPLPKWPYGLNINTLLAIFVAVIKASAGLVIAEGISHIKWTSMWKPQSLETFEIFDKASRGPWGSVLLLFKGGWRHVIPAIGAIATILSLPLDPFAQQIVHFYDCSVGEPTAFASLPRTNYYTGVAPGDLQKFSFIRGGFTSLGDQDINQTSLKTSMNGDIGLLQSTYRQLFAGTTAPHIEPICSTGNCTFAGGTSSLGSCSVCRDTSSDIVITTDDAIGESNATVRMATREGQDSRELTLKRYRTTGTWGAPSQSRIGDFRPDDPTRFRTQVLLRFEENTEAIEQLVVDVGRPSEISGNDITFLRSNEERNVTQAYTCSFLPCVRTYSTSVEAGVINEVETSRAMLPDPPANAFDAAVADLECLDDRDRRHVVLRSIGYEFDDATRLLPYNASLIRDDQAILALPRRYSTFSEKGLSVFHTLRCNNDTTFTPPTSAQDAQSRHLVADPADATCWRLDAEAANIVPLQCIYSTRWFIEQTIQQTMWEEITAGVLRKGHTSMSDNPETRGGRNGGLTPTNSWDWQDGPPVLRAFHESISDNNTLESFQTIMENIALAMTNHMRTHGHPAVSAPSLGTATRTTVCVSARWEWISYAAVVVALFLIFFVGTVVQTSVQQRDLLSTWMMGADGMHDFKSSSLPLLFHGFDRSTREELWDTGKENLVGECEERARGVKVRLVPSGEGWKIAMVRGEKGVDA